MLVQPGDYADALRAVGLFLDQQDATSVAITGDGEDWSVAWDRAHRLALRPSELDALRSVARLHRGLPPRPAYHRPQQLRAIGRLFDQVRASGFAIAERPGGYEVTARVQDQEGGRQYEFEELVRLSADYAADRSA